MNNAVIVYSTTYFTTTTSVEMYLYCVESLIQFYVNATTVRIQSVVDHLDLLFCYFAVLLYKSHTKLTD
jgi:hypothetical protein